MTRNRLRKVLAAGGVTVGNKYDGATATIVEFCDEWGITPAAPGFGNDVPDIKRALSAANVPWMMGNMVLVNK